MIDTFVKQALVEDTFTMKAEFIEALSWYTFFRSMSRRYIC